MPARKGRLFWFTTNRNEWLPFKIISIVLVLDTQAIMWTIPLKIVFNYSWLQKIIQKQESALQAIISPELELVYLYVTMLLYNNNF